LRGGRWTVEVMSGLRSAGWSWPRRR